MNAQTMGSVYLRTAALQKRPQRSPQGASMVALFQPTKCLRYERSKLTRFAKMVKEPHCANVIDRIK